MSFAGHTDRKFTHKEDHNVNGQIQRPMKDCKQQRHDARKEHQTKDVLHLCSGPGCLHVKDGTALVDLLRHQAELRDVDGEKEGEQAEPEGGAAGSEEAAGVTVDLVGRVRGH